MAFDCVRKQVQHQYAANDERNPYDRWPVDSFAKDNYANCRNQYHADPRPDGVGHAYAQAGF